MAPCYHGPCCTKPAVLLWQVEHQSALLCGVSAAPMSVLLSGSTPAHELRLGMDRWSDTLKSSVLWSYIKAAVILKTP